jgi:DNA-binding NtrC family response regulator
MEPVRYDQYPMTLLYVDDDLGLREAIGKKLSGQYPLLRLIFVESSAEFHMIVAVHQPDIYIVNLDMPYANWFTLSQEITKRHKEGYIIGISSCISSEVASRCLKTCIKHYVVKPVNLDIIFFKINNMMKSIISPQQDATLAL